jgi:hypothetical protein
MDHLWTVKCARARLDAMHDPEFGCKSVVFPRVLSWLGCISHFKIASGCWWAVWLASTHIRLDKVEVPITVQITGCPWMEKKTRRMTRRRLLWVKYSRLIHCTLCCASCPASSRCTQLSSCTQLSFRTRFSKLELFQARFSVLGTRSLL